ncbi:hypothetical protein BZG78_04520 [Salinivibrio sp. MA351]|uniref:Y-family DNA polymerase n=1 Tax=Salinivibrio sp. MA351 TaxID=1909453 RepID=UPI000988C656|nr:DNA polymerase Y family protein [Salinivibrio sp. MA351]OOF00487.1 hypothetical protein BZG78_04520 [Salinivibrio sp. MA351]
MTLWLYLHCPSLLLDSLYVPSPEQAVGLVNEQEGRLVQLSVAANTHGLNTGMGLGAAAVNCHQLAVYPYCAKKEQSALEQIATQLYPLVAEISLNPPKGLWLHVSPMLALYQGFPPLWQAVTQTLVENGIRYQAGVGQTPRAAELMAYGHAGKISTDPEHLQAALQQLPLAAAPLPDTVKTQFTRLGLSQLGELIALPTASLTRRFPRTVVDYLAEVSGDKPTPLRYFQPPLQFFQQRVLLFELSEQAHLLPIIENLVSALCHFLEQRSACTPALTLGFSLRDNREETLSVVAAHGEKDPDRWMALVRLRLASWQVSQPVTAVSVAATHIDCHQPGQVDLFSPQQGDQSRDELVATLAARLGEEAVMRLAYVVHHRPEAASQHLPHHQRVTQPTSVPTRPRPSLLLPQPTPLVGKVTLREGPERIVTGWWEDAPIQRDYFIAQNAQQQWLWVFRTPEQTWFLHGWFS